MQKKWQKLGLIYPSKETKRHPLLLTHASNPIPIYLEGNTFRIFYNGRDEYNRSSIGAVDIDLKKLKVVYAHFNPFFHYGSSESFYSHGVSLGDVYDVSNKRYILFMGWQNKPNEHWRGDIGRLVLTKNFKLELDSQKPVFECDHIDPLSFSYPFVLKKNNSNYQMWYGSTITWDAGNNEMVHVINTANSSDGLLWTKKGLAIPYKLNIAQAFSRPTVVTNSNGDLEMWFSFRGGNEDKYRIGHALYNPKSGWVPNFEYQGIEPSSSGWDSEMIEYPYVFRHKEELYMLYNGNSYGKTGFGLAKLERE